MQYAFYSAYYQQKLTNILLDIKQNRVLWSGAGMNFGIPYFPLPVWRPDESGIACRGNPRSPSGYRPSTPQA